MPNEPGSASQSLAELLADAIAALTEHGESGLDEFLAGHPAQESALRRRIDLLRASGMLGPPPDEAQMPKQLGEFELGPRLGSGGMGVVHAAYQPSLGRQVALKLIRPEHLYFPGARERFRREIEAIARLEHPGIVRVYSAGEESGVPYYAMERVAGLSLDRLLRELRDQDPSQLDERIVRDTIAAACGLPAPAPEGGRGLRWRELCCRFACDLALAVDHAHRNGVLHRDLKPSNVIVTPELAVKLLDFGLASTQQSVRLTRTGSQVGSLPYMAPEQLRGNSAAIDERTDVYALGVTLFELLAMRSPFLHDGETEVQTRRRILDGDVPRLRAVHPQIGWDLETVCATAMELDPARRYPSAAELARDLHNVMTLRPITARRLGPARRLSRLARRHPAWTVGVALGSLAFLVAPTLFAVRESMAAQEIKRANDEARIELRTKDSILEFLNRDLLAAVAPEEAGRDVPMRAVLDRAAERIEGRFPDLPTVEAEIRETIGHTYTLLGDYAKAEPHLQRAIQLSVQHRGPAHESTLECRRQLALLYSRLQRLGDAAKIGAEVVAGCEASLGPEHSDTLTAKNNLALVLLRQARFDEAEPLLRSVVDVRRRVLGDDHRHTLASIANLGLLYFETGRPKEAEIWWKLDLDGSRRALAPDDPDLLVTLLNWANLQTALGRDEDSRAIHADLVERSTRVHGARSAWTIDRISGLAAAECRVGDHTGALARIADALERCSELPPHHPSLAHAQLVRAQIRAKAGQPERALDEIESTIETLRNAPDHRPIQLERAEVARVELLLELGRCEDVVRSCMQLAARVDPARQRSTRAAEIATYHGKALLALGRHVDAARALSEAEALWRETAPRHELVPQVHAALVDALTAEGRATEAAAWRETAREWSEGVHR